MITINFTLKPTLEKNNCVRWLSSLALSLSLSLVFSEVASPRKVVKA